MNPGSWRRIEEIFGQALVLAPAERPSLLDQKCADDTELRREVEALLRADNKADGFLDEVAVIPEVVAPAPRLEKGERLGPYRVLRQIGEGGMGTIFLAERDDGSFSRQVAVKVLRGGAESQAAFARLEQERRILAGLDHPGIARLLDGGTTAAGSPYVVMELVDGEPIDQACDSQELSVDQRIDLVIEVCEAVTAAHRSLVVHRDIKPSNILVDGAGRPKLLDFGIAKLLEPTELEHLGEPTASWEQRMTPSYASPEQLRGDPITVGTDVYQLGVLLYKLLTGELPHLFESRSLIEIERIVTTRTPRRPSQVADHLDGDLDAIVLKALRGDAAARYGSVEELAQDLRRFRGGRPVLARQGNMRYLAGKFFRRHWLPLAATSLFVLVVATAAVASAVQSHRLQRALGRLVAVEGFIVDLFWTASPQEAKGRSVLVQEVLERGEKQLAEGRVREPGSRGLLHALFGRISLHLGELEGARYHLERALEAYDKIGRNTALEIAAMRAQSDLALTLLHLETEEDYEKVEPLATQALARARQISPDDAETLLELLNNLMTIYCLRRKWVEAEPLANEAHVLAEGLQTELEGGQNGWNRQVARALDMKALILKNKLDNSAAAKRLYEEALDIYRRTEGENYPENAGILNQLALIARDEDDFDTSRARLNEALEVLRTAYPRGHWAIGKALYNLSDATARAGDDVAAEEALREAVEIYRQSPAHGPLHGRTVFVILGLAEVRLRLGQAPKVEEMLRGLPATWWSSGKPTSKLRARGNSLLGCCLAAQGHLDEAETLLVPSLDILRQRFGDKAPETSIAVACLEQVRR